MCVCTHARANHLLVLKIMKEKKRLPSHVTVKDIAVVTGDGQLVFTALYDWLFLLASALYGYREVENSPNDVWPLVSLQAICSKHLQ